MAIYSPSDAEALRAEIAAAAARMIAEDGADYATAKRKAAKQILGNSRVRGDVLPDNSQIEEEVRQYNDLFFGDEQPARLYHLRTLALELMEMLDEYTPYLTGAVLNGTAGPHSDIHLQLFTDNGKEVAMALLNRNIDFEVSENRHFHDPKQSVEVLSFLWEGEGVHLALYLTDDLRRSARSSSSGSPARASISAVRELIAQGKSA